MGFAALFCMAPVWCLSAPMHYTALLLAGGRVLTVSRMCRSEERTPESKTSKLVDTEIDGGCQGPRAEVEQEEAGAGGQ